MPFPAGFRTSYRVTCMCKFPTSDFPYKLLFKSRAFFFGSGKFIATFLNKDFGGKFLEATERLRTYGKILVKLIAAKMLKSCLSNLGEIKCQ